MKINISSIKPKYHYNFSVNNTGIIGVYGNSGSGKSSLLNAIAGYQDDLTGSMKYNHNTLFDTEKKKPVKVLKCSYLNQHPLIFPHWSIAENLAFALEHSSNNQENLDALINKLECRDLLDKLPRQLSGGEKQRIAYVRALVQTEENSIVLLDEPFSALDENLREIALNILNNYKHMCLIFLVTHEISEIYRYADELLYIEDGIITYQNQIEKAMSSRLVSLPIASRIMINEKRHVIYADDVSICLKKNPDSSIKYQIRVLITDITSEDDSVILTLKMIKGEKQQYLYSKILKSSLTKLDLKVDQTVICQFKSTSFI